ncbi:MAG: arsenic transporter [Edaphobacter sp.]|uniref:arsenic transporter n=1 Tax=Edaphobacter sp. TaxID=1934404 RepID=UPI0023993D14|nr:arsenic transporter [Edaphobacter sp.]MDE1175786.1 arsenic transporter [Edaphobacter sp.]
MGGSSWLLCGICALSIVLMLLRPRRIAEAWWVAGGALLLLALGLVPWRVALHAVGEGTDVYLFLAGMMLLSELALLNGVFDWLAANAVRHAKHSVSRLFVLVYVTGTLVTVLMSNDATAVVMTPAVLAAVKRTKSQPLPFLFACAMIANAASFVLPISNPANLVVFRSQMPPLGSWMAMFLLPSLASIVVTFVVLRWWFRRDLVGEAEDGRDAAPLTPGGRMAFGGIALMAVVLLAASALHADLGLPAVIVGVVLTLMVSRGSGAELAQVFKGVSWSVLPLVAGLFVMVEAVNRVGLLALAERTLLAAEGLPLWQGVFATGFAVGVGNNLVNNLPLGLIAGAAVQAVGVHGALAKAVLIGVDMGPNLSVTGSLATILWLQAIRSQGMHVSAKEFLKVGLVAMPMALLAALGCVLLGGR